MSEDTPNVPPPGGGRAAWRRTGFKLLKFFAWGLPAFALAIPLNWLLVERAHLAKPPAYALVLLFQVVVNFFACWFFVFDTDRKLNPWKSLAVFLNGIALFRLADWALYSYLTTRHALPFLGVQLFNVFLFGFLKFEFSRRVFERKAAPRPPGGDRGTAE